MDNIFKCSLDLKQKYLNQFRRIIMPVSTPAERLNQFLFPFYTHKWKRVRLCNLKLNSIYFSLLLCCISLNQTAFFLFHWINERFIWFWLFVIFSLNNIINWNKFDIISSHVAFCHIIHVDNKAPRLV